jgi:predicted nucleotidyltransferase
MPAGRRVLSARYLWLMSQLADCVAERRDLAEQLCGKLRAVDGVSAVAVFGSTGRGDATEDSDLDLLVITTTRADPRRVRGICREVRSPKVSPVLHTWRTFERLKKEDWLFVKHVCDEGITLWDRDAEFGARCRVSFPGDRTVTTEIRAYAEGLERLGDLERYGDDFLFPLANVYGLTKRVAMLANSRAGLSTFNREQALGTCAELYPQASRDLMNTAALAPFYAKTRGVHSVRPPFSSDGAGTQLLVYTAALRRVIDRVSID